METQDVLDPDLDPTLNYRLTLDLRARLLHKIQIESTKKKKKTIEAVSELRAPSSFSGSPRAVSKERGFGKNMRRLLKLVTLAFMNPSE
jgi:hypothetical protein